MILGDEERSFDMEWLRDYRDASCEREHLLRTDDRVECTETCIVQYDRWLRDTRSDQGFFHELGFIVTQSSIIPRDEYPMDLSTFIEHLRRFDTCGVEEIHTTTTRWGRCTEQESDLSFWDTLDISKDISSYAPWDIEPRKECKKYEKGEDDGEFTHDDGMKWTSGRVKVFR